MSSENSREKLALLTDAGRLLLEYNESAEGIYQVLRSTAKSLSNDDCQIAVSYSNVAVSLGDDGVSIARIKELRFNTALQARVHEILRQVRQGDLEVGAAIALLSQVEKDVPRHQKWLVAILLGAAAACLACLLRADAAAAVTATISTGLGFVARQELARRRASILVLPFVAALIGALLGAVAIRFGWTNTPALALIVPSLILVPGPHIINGLLDLIDNHVTIAISRLALAASILVVTALGITVGIKLVLLQLPSAENQTGSELGLFSDMFLAGIVTLGFAVAYNTAWRHVAMAVIGGMLGHGVRYAALQGGFSLDAATLMGGFAVGVTSACIAMSTKTPVAVIAFAGAVTMMPGVQMYRALGAALRLARLDTVAETSVATEAAAYAMQACLIAEALALGLVVGVRIVTWLVGHWGRSN